MCEAGSYGVNHHNRMAPTRFPISHTGDSVLSALYERSDVSFGEPRCPGLSHADSRDISPGFRTGQLEKRSCPERLERSGPLTLLWRPRPARVRCPGSGSNVYTGYVYSHGIGARLTVRSTRLMHWRRGVTLKPDRVITRS